MAIELVRGRLPNVARLQVGHCSVDALDGGGAEAQGVEPLKQQTLRRGFGKEGSCVDAIGRGARCECF